MKTHFNLIASFLLIGLLSTTAVSQTTGSFTKTITYDSIQRNVYYFVPKNYDPTHQYPLIVGLHGCDSSKANPAAYFRDTFAFLSDSLNAIVACPEGLRSVFFGFMGWETPFIIRAIDSTKKMYSIDSNYIYLTGFSCNGYTATAMGLQKVFPFRGILPFNPAYDVRDFDDTSFVYTNNVPTCICAGTADPGYAEDQQMRDSLVAHNAPLFFNSMPNIGHTISFPTMKDEVMKCFKYFSSVTTISGGDNLTDLRIQLYPNPTSNNLYISCSEKVGSLEIYSILGERVYSTTSLSAHTGYEIDLSNSSKGIYFVKIYYKNSVYTRKIILQ